MTLVINWITFWNVSIYLRFEDREFVMTTVMSVVIGIFGILPRIIRMFVPNVL